MSEHKTAPLDVVAAISVKFHASGALSVSGNIGDLAFALQMLDHAKDAIRSQHRKRESGLIVPGRDVDLSNAPTHPVRPLGDMKPSDRGDVLPDDALARSIGVA